MAPHGRIALVEFAPNDDRVSPPGPAAFAMNMLTTTQGGDAYTANELGTMLRCAGFSDCEFHTLLPTPETAIVATKR